MLNFYLHLIFLNFISKIPELIKSEASNKQLTGLAPPTSNVLHNIFSFFNPKNELLKFKIQLP